MEKTRKIRLMVRWSIVTAGAIALFWTVWYLISGSVPEITALKMSDEWTFSLPAAISRWWDVLLGPICSLILISLFTSKKVKENQDLVAGLVAGLGFGLVAGLGFGLVVGLVTGLGDG